MRRYRYSSGGSGQGGGIFVAIIIMMPVMRFIFKAIEFIASNFLILLGGAAFIIWLVRYLFKG